MIFLDANIVLEILLPERANRAKVERWIKQNRQPVCISMLTVHLILHFGGLEKLPKRHLDSFIRLFTVQDLLVDDYSQAMKLVKDRDYEDALQLAVAKRSKCQSVITQDKNFARLYADIFPVYLIK